MADWTARPPRPTLAPCAATSPWPPQWCHVPFRRDNVIPEANASLGLRTRLGGGVSFEVRGTAWSGLSSTRSFIYRSGAPARAEWAPSPDDERPPRAEHVRSGMLSVGLAFRQ